MPSRWRLIRRGLGVSAAAGALWSLALLLGLPRLAPCGWLSGLAFAVLLGSLPVAAWLLAKGRRSRAVLLTLAVLLLLPHALAWSWPLVGSLRGPSISRGSTGNGSLSGSRAFAPHGRGHVTFSWISSALGRQHAHSRVVEAVTEGLLEASRLEGRRFILGETGWPGGGDFRPHHTHRNGLSVDLFVPFENESGQDSSPWFTPWSWFGYRFEIDARGRFGRHRVDWDALVQELVSIDAAAARHGLAVQRVILAPELQPLLLAEGRSERLGALASSLSTRASWWRHDEHVHVDFRLMKSD